MDKTKLSRTLVFIFAAFVVVAAIGPAALANSAEPPGLAIIVVFAPDDLELSLRYADGQVVRPAQFGITQKAWETY